MKAILTFLSSILLTSFANAALYIHVEPETKEYYLTGMAIGTPARNFGDTGSINWDNGLQYDGGYVEMLSEAAFEVQDNTSAGSFILFLHGNGNVNGAMDFATANLTTLTGNSAVRYDYSTWEPNLQQTLEGKAQNSETVSVANGASSSFELQFQMASVPEPSSGLLVAGAVGAFLLVQRKRRKTCFSVR